jgi:transcriptional regulator with XRE-family HTH domain
MRYLNGYSIPNLAEMYGLSNARIHQILHGRRN